MTRRFSDPYVAEIYHAVENAPKGMSRADMEAEHPEEEAGELNHALKFLRDNSAIASVSGRYFTPEHAGVAPQPAGGGPVVVRAPINKEARAELLRTFARPQMKQELLPVVAEPAAAEQFQEEVQPMPAAAPVPAAIQPEREQTAMPKTARAKRTDLQEVKDRIVAMLAKIDADAPASQQWVAEEMPDVAISAVTRAFTELKAEKRIAVASKHGRVPLYALVRKGKKAAPKKAARKVAKRAAKAMPRPPKAERQAVDVKAQFGVFSDGRTVISKDGDVIELNNTETIAFVEFMHSAGVRSRIES